MEANEQLLLLKLREMDLAAEVGAATIGLSLDQIAAQLSATKLRERERKEVAKLARRGDKPPPYHPPGGWRMDPKKSLRIPPKVPKPDPIEYAMKKTTIDKYREMMKPKTWDGGFTLPTDLSKELWRQTGGDTSGHRIFNLTRDEDPNCIRWKPGAYDKDLPEPSLDLITPSFRDILKRHVSLAPIRVKKEYEAMHGKTTMARELKARVGSDLHKLQTTKEKVLAELASSVISESSSVFERRAK